jgi:hypothetical protein
LWLYTAAPPEQTGGTASKVGGDSAAPAPAGKEAAKRDQALIRFINADPSSQAWDLWFGDLRVSEGVRYKSGTSYLEVPAERRDFRLTPAGTKVGDPVTTNTEGLTNGQRYTVVAFRTEKGQPTIKLVKDDIKRPEVGNARVRFINAARGFGDFDVGDNPGKRDGIFANIDFNSSTDFKEVEAPRKLTLFQAKSGTKLMTDIEPAKSYTFVVVGGQGKKAEIVRIEDELTS